MVENEFLKSFCCFASQVSPFKSSYRMKEKREGKERERE
jgi:hypothetical protein